MAVDEAPAAAPGDALAVTLRGAWPSLPALLCGSAALCAAAGLLVVLAPGPNPLAPLLGALLLGPPAAALCHAVNRIGAADADGAAGVRDWLAGLRHWRTGALTCLVPAVPGAVALLSLDIWRQDGGSWVLPSLVVSGALAVTGYLALPAALALATARPGLRGRLRWICALHVCARRPVRCLAAPVVLALGVWASVSWTASLLLLVPAPVALVSCAAVWTTVAELPASDA